MSVRSLWLPDDDVAALTRQIAFYKRLRPLVTASSATDLAMQATGDEKQWDLLQETGTAAASCCSPSTVPRPRRSTTVSPANLPPDAVCVPGDLDRRQRARHDDGAPI